MTPLEGERLLAEIRRLRGSSRAEILRATGYARRSGSGQERLDSGGFLTALLAALQAQKVSGGDPAPPPPPRPPGTSAGSDGGTEPRRAPERAPAVEPDDGRHREITDTLIKTVIAVPLLRKMEGEGGRREAAAAREEIYDVIITLNQTFGGGRQAARAKVKAMILEILGIDSERAHRREEGIDRKSWAAGAEASVELARQYVFAHLSADSLRRLVIRDGQEEAALAAPRTGITGRGPLPMPAGRAIFQIWEDFPIRPLLYATVATVKADAARTSFSAGGGDIVWAVIDSGIDGRHPHFERHRNLGTSEDEWHQWHRDFTGEGAPLEDGFGHGTHVAGILGGEIPAIPATSDGQTGWVEDHPQIRAYVRARTSDEAGETIGTSCERLPLRTISGIAPKTKLVSLKVLDREEKGRVSNILAALDHVQQVNLHGRHLRIHGVNLSLGYPFEPEWFACGQSQICVEVNRLVRSGVMVVVSAGNTGSLSGGLSIMDPGNAELAITVGSTHRTMPHLYGVSYFSSRGPTGDGRPKPDLLAPGEKVVSCAADGSNMLERLRRQITPAGSEASALINEPINYLEDSGTSMAAPHVSGAAAALLSIRREFIGQPERVKEIFMKSATDLGRVRAFQGAGLIDLMRAIQSV